MYSQVVHYKGWRSNNPSSSSILFVRHRELILYTSCWGGIGVGCPWVAFWSFWWECMRDSYSPSGRQHLFPIFSSFWWAPFVPISSSELHVQPHPTFSFLFCWSCMGKYPVKVTGYSVFFFPKINKCASNPEGTNILVRCTWWVIETVVVADGTFVKEHQG